MAELGALLRLDAAEPGTLGRDAECSHTQTTDVIDVLEPTPPSQTILRLHPRICRSPARPNLKGHRIHYKREPKRGGRRERDDKTTKQSIKTLTQYWSSLQAAKTEKSNWGDEIEYMVLRLNHEAREVNLSLRCSQILGQLREKFPGGPFDLEACKYMLESQPRRPYGNSLRDLAHVEDDMRDRRRMAVACLSEDERLLNLTNVALLGSSHMDLDCEDLITDKPRYQDMFGRLPGRAPEMDDNCSYEVQSVPLSSDCGRATIKIRHAVESWGGCALQATFSARNLQDACRLHDQLIPLGPLMLALSAATPIYKGRLVATDTRWEAMCWAGDDRKSSEKPDLQPRSGCTPMYLEEAPSARQMNDQVLKSAEGTKSDLYKHGVPPALATYLAHVLGRAPLVGTACMPETDDMSTSAQDARMESLNVHMSTWWPHVRLKLPVLSNANDSLPWRVEFRPMEAQPSDMENAALVVALRVLQQTIQHFNLDLKIPISAVEQNMNRANNRNAATEQLFRFAVRSMGAAGEAAIAFDGWASLDVILDGNSHGVGQTWRGLLPLARDYLAHRNISSMHSDEQDKILGALDLLSARASGRMETPAKWMRRFVAGRSRDSLRDEEISSRLYYDMILALSE